MMKYYDRSRSICEWERLDEWRDKIRTSLAGGETSRISPFHLLSLAGFSAAEQRRCADVWMSGRLAASAEARSELDFDFDRPPQTKIRLGYLSADFQEHATAYLLAETLEAHDRDRFELYAYSYGADDGGAMRQRLQHCFDRFIDLGDLTIADCAKAIYSDRIDILIDLKGYTRGTRSEILTYRPAPIQVNYLGYPGTMGGDFCDYIISDNYVTPPASAGDYSEALACMPGSYQPHGCDVAIGRPSSRAEQGLPADGFVFCCFNQAYKIMPETFDIWCRLLYNTPGSVLWLLKNSQAKGRLRNEAYQRGISPERLVFADEVPQPEHLARLRLADLVLDTAPYNAHTTASDALWVGVPLVTCTGDTFASRVAGSLLRAVNLEQLIAEDADAYYALALALSSHPQRLAEIRQQLQQNRLSVALFDSAAYTLHLEALYQTMWDRHLAGQLPAAIGQTC
ncbi:UDP-N-acetylglucosamine-peptide N-acetylglucosaminyltransferase [Methylomonas sp. SURF-1]|uniref:UDP-N-acetylglucosamine-peptide N-acetylglucosaminyltransferase n=1 Tax=Methylomonas aurea TaxID=2952224 RepID=A0ABT1UMQ3_9GAMM|nr:UDP-N-acetylglucosamine-peptide N-acetylglucosaminyltransferase [Methylomonas sp. SURF-1]MCQ8183519.1 UDP-N-acetylglucosamine-peptide N-acetylglucosaminyltransferase [Methylomonas sp. SURF-1]